MFKVEIMRIIKTPINWLFSVVAPVTLVVLFGLLMGKEFLNSGLMGLILLVSLTGTIIPISIYLCSDKVEKRIKHYLIIKGAIQKYTLALYLVNLLVFIVVSLLIFLISVFAFKITINYQAVLMLLTFPLISYTLAFMLAIILGDYANSLNSIIPLSMLVFYIFLFLAGFIVPLQHLLTNNKTFYYIEVLTPFGCLYMFYSHVIGAIDLSITKLIIASLVLLGWVAALSYFLFLAIKTFKT